MGKNISKQHHWWPVGLQQYWADKDGDVSWIEPDGTTRKKRVANRKIGLKFYGHTIARGSVWENCFEGDFDIDNNVHQIITNLRNLMPLGSSLSDLRTILTLLKKRECALRDMCKFHVIDEKLHRDLLLFIYSLPLRSPARRFTYENYPTEIGLPPSENTGKANIVQNYRAAKQLCQTGRLSSQCIVVLHSPKEKFLAGDGYFDCVTDNLFALRLQGRVLVPLTPNICVYLCSPNSLLGKSRCASLRAPAWLVEWINEVTQIYSRDYLFFLGKTPKLIPAYRQKKFMKFKHEGGGVIDSLDDIFVNHRTRGVQLTY